MLGILNQMQTGVSLLLADIVAVWVFRVQFINSYSHLKMIFHNYLIKSIIQINCHVS